MRTTRSTGLDQAKFFGDAVSTVDSTLTKLPDPRTEGMASAVLLRRNLPTTSDPIDTSHRPRRPAAELFKSAVRRIVAKPITREDVQKARQLTDALTYKKVLNAINLRYKSFSQADQIGFGGRDGLTGDIYDIQLQDLIGILRHIADVPALSERASKKSAISPLFDKIYLMEDRQQGWNLRLHEFLPGGKAQGDEELPHIHRWTLASKILMGGYDNKNYREIPASEVAPNNARDQLLNKYRLNPSPVGAAQRELIAEGEFGMRQIKSTLFQAGDVRHFPIELPHSVGDLSAHTGTSLTLAHTGRPVSDSSFAYLREKNLVSSPLEKPSSLESFAAALQDKIALLQAVLLSNALHNHLQERPVTSLTEGERQHLQDYKAPNYLETSLIPALAIARLAENGEIASSEFSAETMKFLNNKLKAINESSLDVLIKKNQQLIESNAFSVHFSSWSALKAHVEQPD